MAEFPALPLFTDAYLADTGHLSGVESGAYLHLLIIAWRMPDCALPDDDLRLARWARFSPHVWKQIKPIVMSFWDLRDGMWTQKRLLDERAEVTKLSEVRRSAALHRWGDKPLKNKKGRHAKAMQMESMCNAPTPTPTPNKERNTDSNVVPLVESPSGLPRKYGFEGKVVRLSESDFKQWSAAFSQLDLAAELTARDAWLSADASDDDRKRWFISTSKYLANRNADAKAKTAPRQRDPNDLRNWGIV